MVTPPPCFTAGGSSPQQLATSPMEDLLIEHPSMSVYHSQGHEPSMKAPSPSSGMVTRARARQQQQGKQVAVRKLAICESGTLPHQEEQLLSLLVQELFKRQVCRRLKRCRQQSASRAR